MIHTLAPSFPSRPTLPMQGSSRHISQANIDISPPIPKSGGAPGSPSSSFKDLTPTNFPPAHESRRRNAEQRAATLEQMRLSERLNRTEYFVLFARNGYNSGRTVRTAHTPGCSIAENV
ncbi:hypothetical protein JVU11DRAFT_6732 [Chiua virens]|nr:hypothetical protein JVU11DRAFT_6732 [Chiua virens]